MKKLLKTGEFLLDHLIGIPLLIIYFVGLLIVQLFEVIPKKLTVIIFVLTCYNSESQIVVGMGAGAINFKSIGFTLQAGITFGKETIEKRQKENYLYYSQTVNNARGDKPQILGVHYGRNFGSIQPYIGAAYHLGRTDIKHNKRSGFKPDYGITKYFPSTPIYLSVGRSGNINLITVGIYKVL